MGGMKFKMHVFHSYIAKLICILSYSTNAGSSCILYTVHCTTYLWQVDLHCIAAEKCKLHSRHLHQNKNNPVDHNVRARIPKSASTTTNTYQQAPSLILIKFRIMPLKIDYFNSDSLVLVRAKWDFSADKRLINQLYCTLTFQSWLVGYRTPDPVPNLVLESDLSKYWLRIRAVPERVPIQLQPHQTQRILRVTLLSLSVVGLHDLNTSLPFYSRTLFIIVNIMVLVLDARIIHT